MFIFNEQRKVKYENLVQEQTCESHCLTNVFMH